MEAQKCKTGNCKRPYRAKGYCGVHYREWRHGKLPHPRYNTCSQEECHKKVVKHGLCEEHLKVQYPKLFPKTKEAAAPAPAEAASAPEAPSA